MLILTSSLIAALTFYTLILFVVGRRTPMAVLLGAPQQLFFVFLVPCLNEELVIAATLERLLAMPGDNMAVLVVDDGSTDRTVDIVRSLQSGPPSGPGQRIWLLRREPPLARQGKGEALNAGFRYLVSSDRPGGRSVEDVVVVILDADGRVDGDVMARVGGHFRDSRVGAVQIGVRMYNVGENLLTRLQDFEFVTFGRVFQRSRHFLGSSGLGGNGQFARLGALRSLGLSPWTRCLTEDLDLGIRLLAAGWRLAFCPDAVVSQQAVTRLSPLLRQRTRWFQGHLQCWPRIPLLAASDLPLISVLDVLYHLTGPALVLVMTVPVTVFAVSVITLATIHPGLLGSILTSHHGLLLVIWYALSFGMCPVYASAYREATGMGRIKSLALAHLFTFYAYLWFPAGWAAIWRILRQRNGWRKTARTPDPDLAAP